jgi:hypothetical protein
MNAITPIGGPALLPHRFGRLREQPIPGEDSVLVTVDGTPLRVFHTAGRPTSVHIQLPDGIILAGVMAADAAPGSLHAVAAKVADGLLAGLRQAGEYPSPSALAEAIPGLRVVLLSVAVGVASFAVMWGVVALAALRDWQR